MHFCTRFSSQTSAIVRVRPRLSSSWWTHWRGNPSSLATARADMPPQTVRMEEESPAGEPGGAPSSRLFLLRLWQEGGGWEGRLQDLRSGEAWSLAGWEELSAVLLGGEAGAQALLRVPENADVHPREEVKETLRRTRF